MKKVFSIALLLSCIISFSSAQFGIKGGYNFSAFDKSEIGMDVITANNYTVGISYNINMLLGFSIQPEILYTQRGAVLKDPFYPPVSDDYKFEYIDIPLLLRYALPNPIVNIYLEAGASYSFLLSGKLTVTDINYYDSADMKEYMTKYDYSIIYGLGLNLSFVDVDVRYVVGQKSTGLYEGGPLINRGIMTTIGIIF